MLLESQQPHRRSRGFERLETRRLLASDSLVISEVMSANAGSLITVTRQDPDDRFSTIDFLTPDWIEIENRSERAVDISDYHLTDDADSATKWSIPAGSVIAPGGFYVVFASGLDVTDPDLDQVGMVHTNFKLNAERGEYLALTSPSGEVVHEFAPQLPRQFPDVSYGLTSGDTGYLEQPTPGEANSARLHDVASTVQISQSRGFYDDPFEVTLTVDTPGTEIYYTLDGSLPNRASGVAYSVPIQVDGTTTLRAVAFKDGFVPARTVTHTYLFLADVLAQPADPVGFPDHWGRAGAADYAMDPRVVASPESEFYDPNVADALRALPTISVVVNTDDFFGTENGLQAFPEQHGDAWERTASVEFIDFETFDDAQRDAGIRMVGKASRNINRRKHNMRLAFRDDYGFSSLDLPLFGLGPGEQHENLLLRGGNGDSWINPVVYRRAQYIRDEWHRDLQAAMGYATPQQQHAHLYINGLYWGMYHVFERFDAAFLAQQLGGDEEAYDAIKDYNGSSRIDVISGDTQAWEELINVVDNETLTVDETYTEVQRRVDVDNMIDYLLINFYTGNNDWDHNNFRAGRRRSEDGRFQFFTWDAERADINALQLSVTQIGPVDRDITQFNKPNRPTHIHTRLLDHEDYRIRFADRVHQHFFHGGPLTSERAAALWNARADIIRAALPAESARWGDLHSPDAPRTAADWQTILDIMNQEFFPQRSEIVLNQFREPAPNQDRNTDPLYPRVAAPVFHINEREQHGGPVHVADELTFSQSELRTVYYTLDESDPRLPGGIPNPTAIRTGTVDLVHPSSVARFLVPTGDNAESGWQSATYDDMEWDDGMAAFGYDTGSFDDAIQLPDGFTVRHVHSTQRLSADWDEIDRVLSGENVKSSTFVEGVPVINYLDRTRDGHFGNNQEFPDGGRANHALNATATMLVQSPGTYTFGVSSNDAARLQLDGTVLLADENRHATRDSFVTVDLTTGVHTLDVTMFNVAGGASVELFVAPGTKTEYDRDFQLLGEPQHRPYDELIETDLESQLHQTTASVYARIPFTVAAPDDVLAMSLDVKFDDGFVAYINGVEVAKSNAPERIDRDSQAEDVRADTTALLAQRFDVSPYTDLLTPGQNALAIHALNAAPNNADLLFSPTLTASIRSETTPLTRGTTVKARTYDAGTWSALNEADFAIAVPAKFDTLRISEVHFHPRDPSGSETAAGHADADDFEFIELLNIGSQTIDLSRFRFAKSENGQGIDFDFANSSVTQLAPGDHVVVVEDLDAFRLRYGDISRVAGQWAGGLSNQSETISLMVDGAIVQQLTYQDNWYPETDGDGKSLVSRDPASADQAAWNTAVHWSPSRPLDGTPGNSPPRIGDTNLDGRFDIDDLLAAFVAGEYQDKISGNSTWREGDWDGDGDFTSLDLVAAFSAGGFVPSTKDFGRAAARRLSLEAAAVESVFDLEPRRANRHDESTLPGNIQPTDVL